MVVVVIPVVAPVPVDYKCPTRGFKVFNTKPVDLAFGSDYTLDIPTTLEENAVGKSYSDYCTV